MQHLEQVDHLLANLAFACDAVAQRAYDACRFGMDEVQAGQALKNEALLWQAMNEVSAFSEMLVCVRGQGGLSREAIDASKAESEAYLSYPSERGNAEL